MVIHDCGKSARIYLPLIAARHCVTVYCIRAELCLSTGAINLSCCDILQKNHVLAAYEYSTRALLVYIQGVWQAMPCVSSPDALYFLTGGKHYVCFVLL